MIGQSEKAAVSQQERLLPLGLSEGAVLKRDVAQGEAIDYAGVNLAEDSFVLKLRREQDRVVW